MDCTDSAGMDEAPTTIPVSKLLLLTTINIFNYLDRYVVNAVLPLLAIEFSLTHAQEGRVAAAFVIGYTLCSPIFGYLGDRFSRPRLMAVGVFLWSLATVLSGLSSTLFFLMGARILVGVGEASFGVIVPGYVKDFERDPIALNKKLALFYVAIPLGSALGYVLGGSIAAAYSWRWAFYIAAFPSIILSACLLRFPEKTNRVIPSGSFLSGIKQLIKNRTLCYAQAGYIFNTFALTSIAAFVPTYGISNLGFELSRINSLFGLILVATGIAGTTLGAHFSSRQAQNAANPIGGLLSFCSTWALLAAPFLAAAFLVKSGTAFLVLAGIAELLIFASLAPINTVLVLSAPAALVTATQGFTVLLINIFGAFLGPQIVGAVADLAGLSKSLQLTTVALFLCAVAWRLGARSCAKSSSV